MNLKAAALAAVAFAGSCAQAAEWRLAPSISTTVVNETNPRLELEPPSDKQAIAANVRVQLERNTETTGASLQTSAAHRRYGEDRSLDRTDLRLDLSLRHVASERVSWSASAAATRDTTLTSELGTSGETGIGYRHESLGAGLQSQWEMSERWTGMLLVHGQHEFYPAADSGLVDYKYHSAGLIGSWIKSPLESLAIVFHVGQLQVNGAPVNSRDSSALLEYTLTFNEHWKMSLAGGPAWARGAASTQQGESLNFDLARRSQYGDVSLSLDRSIAPNGRGYLTRRDSVSLQLNRNLAARMSGSLTARYLRSRNIVGVLAFIADDVRYRRIDAGLSWAFSPQWSTELRAAFSDQQRNFNDKHASGVDLGMSISWNGKNHVF